MLILQVHIVYMGSLSKVDYAPSAHHLSLLQLVAQGSSAENLLVRSYRKSFNGFAAKLTSLEAEKLAGMKGIVSVFPSKELKLHTTRSWDFMGMPETAKRNPVIESDVVVGVIDTGIWPESPSFSDEGFSPAPKKWKGVCNGGANFTCNKKIIGARFYLEDSARDNVGHGSHTASTAAGNVVKDVSFYGLGKGIGRGGVPSARISTYKVCSETACATEDILAAFDDAIASGVDLLTVSLGGSAVTFDVDAIAIGAFHAMEKGILTVNSAGNNGPDAATVASVAPWLLSVAASGTDRRYVDKVVLGNGKTLTGYSINSFSLNGTMFPLVNDGNALVKGKIVLCGDFYCLGNSQSSVAAGAIVSATVLDVSYVVPFPALALSRSNFDIIDAYMNSTKKPQATISIGQTIKDSNAPVVVSFSSRGPNVIAADIMKPDVTAPGVEILAAYSPVAPVSSIADDKRSAKYNILSGTSMSCPHVAGVAAYVKTFRPDWSPSAIKSAIMTTAWPMNATKNKEAEFAYGSGHVDPVKALNPGLVYESLKEDYITFLCSMNYTEDRIKLISGDNSTCSKKASSPRDLNYPSMTAHIDPNVRKSFTVEFHRVVTNVGPANSTYKAQVLKNPKLDIKVVPQVLSFKSLNQKMAFTVTVSGGGLADGTIFSSSLVWSDGVHSVRSPIVVHTYSQYY
ncbi:subtilisin-like protease SBT4.6 [Tripterygium wilfordii]|uniref:subtilisin-like protease SBT4.6 n=1 Tax=Tripterygium wilfordii TaxID=458696 RepID=UPI0018F7F877|nr:subtilisin-like protease SBT4.6 [Tripterygium wilfordii]